MCGLRLKMAWVGIFYLAARSYERTIVMARVARGVIEDLFIRIDKNGKPIAPGGCLGNMVLSQESSELVGHKKNQGVDKHEGVRGSRVSLFVLLQAIAIRFSLTSKGKDSRDEGEESRLSYRSKELSFVFEDTGTPFDDQPSFSPSSSESDSDSSNYSGISKRGGGWFVLSALCCFFSIFSSCFASSQAPKQEETKSGTPGNLGVDGAFFKSEEAGRRQHQEYLDRIGQGGSLGASPRVLDNSFETG